VALAIMEASARAGLTTAQLQALVQTDALLLDRLHSYASSAAGPGMPAHTASQAVGLLDSRTVQQLALCYSLLDQHAAGSCSGFDYGRYWSQALLRGIALRELGVALKLPEGDALFCAGMLARVGCLALACAYPAQYGKIAATGAQGPRRLKLEQKFLQVDHLRVTAELLTQWGLDDALVQGLKFEEQAEAIGSVVPSRAWQLGQAMALAQQWALFPMLSAAEQALQTPVLMDLANRLGLDAVEWGVCADACIAKWQALGAKLSIQTFATPGFDTLVTDSMRPDREVNSAWLRVLVVDDDPIALHIVQEWLNTACGYTVRVAANGVDALALAESFLPHVVLTDWRMPVMDGLELCAALRASDWGKSVYVIMLTSAELESDLVQAFQVGVDDYLNKPINLVALSARMKAAWRYVRLREAWEQDNRRLSQLASELALSNRRLQHASLTDPLTELANRRAGLAAIKQAWSTAVRYSQPLTFISNDIDHFKAVNDTHGHAAGDAVLKHFAHCLRDAARSEDTVCRWGGEEFLIILPNIDLKGGNLAAERFRNLVEASHILFEGKNLRVTASFGVASWRPEMYSFEELLALGDQSLYAAKATGRNCVSAIQRDES
jgi:diguanylate cyclase (GGDEF)-like protein